MSYVQVVVILALATFCSALDYKLVSYPGQCPQVPSSSQFNQEKLLRLWYATHFTNPSFKGIRCATNNVTQTGDGLQFNAKFLNSSGQQEQYVTQLNSTQTPGVYDVSYENPNGTTLHGKQVLYLFESDQSNESHESHESHEEGEKNLYLFTWSCVEKLRSNEHYECAGIQSKGKRSPSAAVQAFQKHLRTHGSLIGRFYQINNDNC